jgi:FtsH-binding integral membrane protein
VARIFSALSIIVLLMFLFGEEFDVSKITFHQWVGFLFFPVGIVIGFIVGWKNEILGGIISILSLLLFYLIYGLLLTETLPTGAGLLIITIPAFLFLICGIYGYLTIKKPAKNIVSGAIKN